MATETTTVEQLIDPLGACLSPDVARRVVDLRADATLQARVDELADKANVGTITAQKVYTMLGKESLWDVAARCHELLSDAGIAYCVCGGVAVCLHGYQRNTTDLDLVIRSEDSDAVRRVLTDAGFKWDPDQAEFQTADGIIIQFLVAGQKAGKGTEVLVSEPIGDLNVEQIEGLSVVRLSRLIEMKIACGMTNLRRTHKDFADVVELIIIRHLDGSFARFLHKSLRPTFRELVRNAQAPDES